MILILIALIFAAVIGFELFRYSEHNNSFAMSAAAMCLLFTTAYGAVAYAFLARHWIASEHKSKIINREFGTNYTAEEVFWASDVIDTIREIDRKRIEVNGDLLREKADR